MDTQEVGFVKSARDFLVYLDGMPTIRINDTVQNDQGVRGLVSALLSDRIEVLLLDEGQVTPGQMFHRLGHSLNIPVGQFLLGRTVNPLGVPIDGKGPLAKAKADQNSQLDKPVPSIGSRKFINKQLTTGITLVDTLIPLGCGQRELVLGDARSGKTDFLINVIVNQKANGVICVYASIGKPVAELRGLLDTLRSNGALPYTIVVAASSTDIAPLIFLPPQAAFSIAEYFQGKGRDVLVILDDMGIHAKIYREISLLGGKAPGRESYPGDIFYQHSHLLERAGNFNEAAGGGSITALPVIELGLSDFTTFIPTNLMSMTDGHFLFRSALYNQGRRPAIDIPLSVSRVGQQTQNRIQNLLANRIKQVLAGAAQLETVSRFSFELPFETQQILRQREALEELTKQPPNTFLSPEIQTALLALPFTKFAQDKDREFVKNAKDILVDALSSDPQLSKITKEVFKLKSEQELIDQLDAASDKLTILTGKISQPASQQPSPQPPLPPQSPQTPLSKPEEEK